MLNTNPLTWTSTPGVRASKGWLGTACLALPDKCKPYTKEEFFKGKLQDVQAKPALEQHGRRPDKLEFYAESRPHCLCVPELSKEDRGVFAEFTNDGDYHVLDYCLFYYNIRQNVSDRLQAFHSKSMPNAAQVMDSNMNGPTNMAGEVSILPGVVGSDSSSKQPVF